MGSLRVACVMIAMLYPAAAIAENYAMHECAENYSTGGCGGTDLPASCDNVELMRDEMADWSGWTNSYLFENSGADPQDWWEVDRVSGGYDYFYADAHQMSVWSGHGLSNATHGTPDYTWSMIFSVPQNSQCYSTSPGQMNFTEQYPDSYSSHEGAAFFVIMDASCSMDDRELGYVWMGCADGNGSMMRTDQAMGFMDSPNDSDGRLAELAYTVETYYQYTSSSSAWLDAGLECYFGFCESNSPIAITKADDYSTASYKHDHVNFFNIGNYPIPYCDGYYVWSYYDNGGRC